MGKFYVVKKGRKVGIYKTWSECQEEIKGFSGAEFKSFKNMEEATKYLYTDNSVIFSEADSYIVAYVDGSYEDSLKRYGSGILVLKDNNVILEKSFGGSEESLISMRNVAGEIKAAEFAMMYCLEKGFNKLVLHYDYLGIEKWCNGEWKAGKSGTIRYKQKYDEFVNEGLMVKFVKVRAHSGDKYNDMADKLAKKGVIE